MVLKEKKVKIKKPHRCHCCLDKKDIGTIMTYSVGINEDFWALYYCQCCTDYIDSVKEFWKYYEDGINEGDFLNDEDYLEYRKKWKIN